MPKAKELQVTNRLGEVPHDPLSVTADSGALSIPKGLSAAGNADPEALGIIWTTQQTIKKAACLVKHCEQIRKHLQMVF